MRTLDWSDSALDQRVKEGSEIAFCRDMIKLELPHRSQRVFKIPEISFDSEIEIDLGGVSCQIKHVGGDHAEDSSIVFIPEDGIVFLRLCPHRSHLADTRENTQQRHRKNLDE